jgi:lipopolysaccharide transport system permease protein
MDTSTGPARSPTATMQTVLSAESALRHPRQFVRLLIRDVQRSGVLFEQLLLRSLRNTYRQSLLGFAWAFIPPIAVAIAFGLMGRAKVLSIAATDIPYAAYVVINMALWQTFVEAVNAPINALAESRPIMTRINFPQEPMLGAKLAEVMINFAIKLLLIAAVFAWYRLPVVWTVVFAPAAVIALILFGNFIGLFLAPISALYKDVSRLMPIVFLFWMFLTPVVFPVPETGLFGLMVHLNPVTPLLVTARELASAPALSQLGSCLIISAVAVCGNVIGLVVVRAAMPYVAERVFG